MKPCLYCLVPSSNFTGEHILSAFLGGPNQLQLNDRVCKTCNSDVISKLESSFKEDSAEGRLAARYQLGRSNNYRTNLKRHSMDTTYEGPLKVDPDFQITISADGSQVIPKQVLLKSRKGRIYNILNGFTAKNIVKKMKALGDKDIEISLWGFDEDAIEKLRQEMLKIGIANVSAETTTIPPGNIIPPRTEVFDTQIDRTMKRVILKTAFNYLSFCALPAFEHVIYGPDFQSARDYVLMSDSEYMGGELVSSESNQEIFFNGSLLPAFSPNHLISFYSEIQEFTASNFPSNPPAGRHSVLVGEINLFSCFKYKINLSMDCFTKYSPTDFEVGCSHVFNVAANTWSRVDRGGASIQSGDFSLFRKKV